VMRSLDPRSADAKCRGTWGGGRKPTALRMRESARDCDPLPRHTLSASIMTDGIGAGSSATFFPVLASMFSLWTRRQGGTPRQVVNRLPGDSAARRMLCMHPPMRCPAFAAQSVIATTSALTQRRRIFLVARSCSAFIRAMDKKVKVQSIVVVKGFSAP